MHLAPHVRQRTSTERAESAASGLHNLACLLVGHPADDVVVLPHRHGAESEGHKRGSADRRGGLDTDDDPSKNERLLLSKVKRHAQRGSWRWWAVRVERHPAAAEVLRLRSLVGEAAWAGRVLEGDGHLGSDADPLSLVTPGCSLTHHSVVPRIQESLLSALSFAFARDPAHQQHEQSGGHHHGPDREPRSPITVERREESSADVLHVVRRRRRRGRLEQGREHARFSKRRTADSANP